MKDISTDDPRDKNRMSKSVREEGITGILSSQTKRLMLGQVEARLTILENYENDTKYGNPERQEGAGPIRFKSTLPLTYDLYSMLFVSVMRHEYIWKNHLRRFRKDRARPQDE